MKKITLLYCWAIVLFVASCKEEQTPTPTPTPVAKPYVPECLQSGLPDLLVLNYNTIFSWKDGGVCGALDGKPWKNFARLYSEKDKAKFSLNFTNYNPIPLLAETSGIENIPLKKGKYNIGYPRPINEYRTSANKFTFWNDDLILDSFSIDTTKTNTIEVLSWDEQRGEVFGVFSIHYLTATAIEVGFPELGTPMTLKDCYFKATVK